MIARAAHRPHGIACPACGAQTEVVETRHRRPNGLYRRRRCPACGERVSTHETIVVPHGNGTGCRFAPASAAPTATLPALAEVSP